MKSKIIKFITCVTLIVTCIFVGSSSPSTNIVIEDNESDEVVDYLVNLALEEADVRIEDYIDLDYFTNLQSSTEITVNEIEKLSNLSSSDEEEYDKISFDEEQYYALKDSITDIFSELSSEEYEVFETLAEEDEDIAEMLTMVENGFEEYDESSQVSHEVATSNVVKLSAAVLTIGSILSGQQVCQAAIVAIKGAFNSMVATLKAFFVPTSVKTIIVTAAILVIATVVIVNWNKIKPVFNQIVNVFVDNAKKLANVVRAVFNTINRRAISANTYGTIDDVFNKNDTIKNKLKSIGKSLNNAKAILKEFLGVTTLSQFYNSQNKVLCIGRDMGWTYKNESDLSGYQNYASRYNYWSFWVENYGDLVSKYTQPLINLINDALIYYCCSNDWDFILVTNPYHYMAEHLDLSYGGNAYSTEIAIIREYNYNYFYNSSLSWANIPNPGNSYNSYFELAGYRVSR